MPSEPTAARRVTLEGTLEREIFATPDRSHVVAELVERRTRAAHVVAGDLSGVAVGDAIEVVGEPVIHPRFGPQLRILSVRWIPPATPEGIRRFLAGGSVAGIGEVLAGRIVERFGVDTIRILTEEPGRLTDVPGVGRKRIEVIRAAWAKRRAEQEEAAFLAGLGLGPAMASRVRRELGDRTAEQVRADPWQLARSIDGIGFKRADEIARRLDVALDAPSRIEAGIAYALAEFAEEGHCFAPRTRLVQQVERLLSLPAGPIEDGLARLTERRELRQEPLEGDTAVYLPRLHAAEEEVAALLTRRGVALLPPQRVKVEPALVWVEPRLAIRLTSDQRAALAALFNVKSGVLTGGPGVGKTTIVRALVEVFERKGLAVALAAPTGRAARRLAEACRRPAATLHRLLKFNPHRGRFEHGRENPLACHVLIVDEASMIDLVLMRDLLRALPDGARLLLVGDADQLPSVGPGDVLRSIVASGTVAVARLTRILRQREGSSIVHAAHAVLRGELPDFERGDGEGAFFVARDDAGAARRAILQIATERLPKRFALDPRRDVQVLSPMNRGALGTVELNELLQETLNPGHPEPLAPGDRVLQTRNNYDLDVMNGEIGFVIARGAKSGELEVDFEDRKVTYPASAVAQLALAYGITVHKSQGCEFPAVVLALSMQHFVLLRRNLLYTAVTRARRILLIVGSRRALATALETGQVEQRWSLLEERLRRGRAAGGRT